MNPDIIIRKATEEDAANILEHVKAVRVESIFLGSHSEDPLPDVEAEKKMLREETDDNMEAYCKDSLFEAWPLAMAYVPWQSFRETYEPEDALRAGTVFPELDLPFLGGGRG